MVWNGLACGMRGWQAWCSESWVWGYSEKVPTATGKSRPKGAILGHLEPFPAFLRRNINPKRTLNQKQNPNQPQKTEGGVSLCEQQRERKCSLDAKLEKLKTRTKVGEAVTLRVRVSSSAGFCCDICGIWLRCWRFFRHSHGRFSCTSELSARWTSLRGQVLAFCFIPCGLPQKYAGGKYTFCPT
jgi:hypothetical protein